MVKKQATTEYAVKRGTRREKMLQEWLYSKMVFAAQQKYGKFNDENWHEAPPEFAAMMAERPTLQAFCRIVLYTDRSNGSHALTTEDNDHYAVPGPNESDEKLLAGYWNWLCTDETVTDTIDQEIKAANAPQVEPELQPKGDLTGAERDDPNGLGGDVKKTDAGTPSPSK